MLDAMVGKCMMKIFSFLIVQLVKRVILAWRLRRVLPIAYTCVSCFGSYR